MKKAEILFSSQAEQIFQQLKNSESKEHQTIARGIDNKVEILKQNPYFGNPIAKRKIPKEYREEYDITNLFRIELPNFWRMLYALTNNEEQVIIIALVVDLLNHGEYDKKFGYRKR